MAEPEKQTAPAMATTQAAPAGAESAGAEKQATAALAAPKDGESKAEEKAADTDAAAVGTPGTAQQLAELYAAAKTHAHAEIWGVALADPALHVPSQIVFQKFLNANDGDVAEAKAQLVKTLDWRAAAKPLELVKKAYSRAKFGGVGYVTTYPAAADAGVEGPEAREIFTWNIYGAVKNFDETFGQLEEFIEWRVALMELAMQDLSLATAKQPITKDQDPYKIYQVHDYKSISFLFPPAAGKAASSETIKVMAQNYPELLKEKFFVNVPAIMGFMYGLMKLFVAPKTLRKFHPMSSGAAMATELKGSSSKVTNLGEQLPTEYGGKGADLAATGKQTALLDE